MHLQGLQHATSHADFSGTKSARALPAPAASWVASKRQHLTELIWEAAGIVRSTAGLKAALLQLASLYVEVRALGQVTMSAFVPCELVQAISIFDTHPCSAQCITAVPEATRVDRPTARTRSWLSCATW